MGMVVVNIAVEKGEYQQVLHVHYAEALAHAFLAPAEVGLDYKISIEYLHIIPHPIKLAFMEWGITISFYI